MKKSNKHLLSVLLVILSILLLTSCGEKEDPTKKDDPTPVTPPKEVHYYSVKFLQDGQVLGSQDGLKEGTLINQPTLDMSDTEDYHYEFIGWDADGDGVGETFPYPLNADTEFNLLYTATSKLCHIEMYVKGTCIQSYDGRYGDYIYYPELTSSINGDDVEIFLGWKYDGVFDGYTYNQITKSCRIDAYYADSQILKMYYNGMLYAKYVNAGAVLNYLADWQVTASAGKQIKWYTDASYTTPLGTSKMPTGNLSIYGREEEVVVAVSDAKSVASQSALLTEFNNMLINRASEGKFSLGFSVSSVDDLISYLVNNGLSMYNYQANASLKGSELSLQLTYEAIAQYSSGYPVYTQLRSFNFQGYANSRSSSYNDFASEKRSDTLKVSNSDALFYALENGYKPVIDSSNTALTALYNKMKDVLRICVRDGMSDIEKAKAIYEYIILETVYDANVLNLTKSGATGLAAYNAFYLEGVFNDHLAVCDGMAKAYACLCNMEGIECVRVTGRTTEGVNHAWNKIKINGSWYVVDVTSGGCISGGDEVLTYSYFMIPDVKYQSHAIEDGIYHAGLSATTSYDVYSNMKMNVSGTEMSLSAKSKDGAAKLFKYFADNAPSGRTSFDIRLAYSYSDMKTALEGILEAAQYNGQVSYIEGSSNNIIIIVSK